MKKHWILLAATLLFLCSNGYAKKQKELTEKQAESIAEDYIDAVQDGDYDDWSELIYNPAVMTYQFYQRWQESDVDVEKVYLNKTYCNVKIREERSSGSTVTHWVQILSTREIKYDSFFIDHPIIQAMKACGYLISYGESATRQGSIKTYASKLQFTGIPLFGYDTPNNTPSDRIKALGEIKEWLLTEGKNWDFDEPKIPCPIDLYEKQSKRLRARKITNPSFPTTPNSKPADGDKEDAPTKREAEKIAQEYINAIQRNNQSKWIPLTHNPYAATKNFSSLSRGENPTISIEAIDRQKTYCNVAVRIRTQFTSTTSGSTSTSESTYQLQILPSGKVKYDNNVIEHPVYTAMQTCYSLIYYNEKDAYRAPNNQRYAKLKETEIPLFGYNPNNPEDERMDALEEIREWLLHEGAVWDRDEPKIPCPEDLFESYSQTLKRARPSS